MLKRLASICLCLGALGAGAGTTFAGGRLETIDITGHVTSFEGDPLFEGLILARVVGMKWDVRAIPVQYKVNVGSGVMSDGVLMVPNPLGPPIVSMADAMTTLQAALDTWNSIPTSYIDMRITGTTNNPGTPGFDFVNEVTFRTENDYAFLADSQTINLIEDTTMLDGDDIDGDGDSDVSNRIKVATDVDGDGDIEFPAGFYKAGTLLDNDVRFNTKANGFRFTVGDAALDTVTRSVDLLGVAVHEFGHSHGLSHSLINQKGATDGGGATMFPFPDTGDPAEELSMRSLDSDDIAYSSLIYPEGTAASGPAALQRGDVAFDRVYGRITGELRHGDFDREPIAGGHVFAVDTANDTLVSGAFSGTTQFALNPVTGVLLVDLSDHHFNILDGKYELPVTAGTYKLGVEPVDGQPVSFVSLNLSSGIGAIFGQLAFNEEFVVGDGPDDEDDERSDSVSGARAVRVKAGKAKKADIVTSKTMNVDDFGTRNFSGYAGVPPGSYYAVAIPASEVTALSQGKPFLIKAAAFDTLVADASVVPVFAEAILTAGTFAVDPGPPASGTASVNLAEPLARTTGFVAQDNDLSPLFFRDPAALGAVVRARIDTGEIQNLFLVLRIPTTTPFPGVSQLAPFIGFDGVPGGTNDVSINNRSFYSFDGATFYLDPFFNYRFSLRLGERRGREHGLDDPDGRE
jgi:matrixin